MDNHSSSLESRPAFAAFTADTGTSAWRDSVRARLFAVVFGTTLTLGVGWTLLQPAVYRSSATVLMSPPSAIDAEIEDANVQSVTIQSRVLLGTDITGQLVSGLRNAEFADVDAQYLKTVLRVEALPDTNLVEMIAEGSDGDLLPALVDSWIDVYLDMRADTIQRTQAQTLAVVQDQLGAMALRIEEARDALAAYRSENRIISAERQQNEELARLEGLNVALNNAVEEEVKARSALESLRKAITSGKDVVPPSERESVEGMERELARLKGRMAKLTESYTLNYINNQPGVREIPERIAALEAALTKERARAERQTLAITEQQHAATLQSVEDLRGRLAAQEQAASRFTTIYARHEALAKDLEELEALHRQTQSRLLKVQANQVEKYPQVEVIDRPSALSERVGPHYLLLLGASVVAALGTGVLAVWLYGFLAPRTDKPAFVTLSGVHLYPQELGGQLAHVTQAAHRIDGPSARLPGRAQAPSPTTDTETGPENDPPDERAGSGDIPGNNDRR